MEIRHIKYWIIHKRIIKLKQQYSLTGFISCQDPLPFWRARIYICIQENMSRLAWDLWFLLAVTVSFFNYRFIIGKAYWSVAFNWVCVCVKMCVRKMVFVYRLHNFELDFTHWHLWCNWHFLNINSEFLM